MEKYEHLYPGDEVIYRGALYWVSNACFMDNDGTQSVNLIRTADLESNRPKRESIRARADECKLMRESTAPEIVATRSEGCCFDVRHK